METHEKTHRCQQSPSWPPVYADLFVQHIVGVIDETCHAVDPRDEDTLHDRRKQNAESTGVRIEYVKEVNATLYEST